MDVEGGGTAGCNSTTFSALREDRRFHRGGGPDQRLRVVRASDWTESQAAATCRNVTVPKSVQNIQPVQPTSYPDSCSLACVQHTYGVPRRNSYPFGRGLRGRGGGAGPGDSRFVITMGKKQRINKYFDFFRPCPPARRPPRLAGARDEPRREPVRVQ